MVKELELDTFFTSEALFDLSMRAVEETLSIVALEEILRVPAISATSGESFKTFWKERSSASSLSFSIKLSPVMSASCFP